MATQTTPLLSSAMQSHLELRELTLADSSLYQERYAMARFVEYVGPKQVGRVTADDYLGFMASLKRGSSGRGSPLGAASLSAYAVRLRIFALWCVSKGWVKVNPFPAPASGGLKVPAHGIRQDYIYLSAVELLTMLDQEPDPRGRALLAMGMNTGLRCSEVLSLGLGDIDLDAGNFYVVITKSKTSDTMPISEDLDLELRSYLQWLREHGDLTAQIPLFPRRGKMQFTGSYQDGVPVRALGALDLSGPMSIATARRFVKDGLTRLGYSDDRLKGEGFHTLRRSVARLYFDDLCLDTGFSNALREVASFLHHKNTTTTEIYLGLDVERARRDQRMKGKPFLTRLAGDQRPTLREVGS